MSNKSFFDKEVLPFSRRLPTCPKCLGKTRRFYSYHDKYSDHGTIFEWLEDGEYFKVICKECSFEFPQHVNSSRAKGNEST
jgi:hypothetical protein